jgi:MFS family permease
MPYWGKIIDKYGTIKTLKATGLLASIYPLALILIRDPVGLTIAEFLSGIIFSGFNLCLASFIYESFKAEKIIKYASYQAALFGTATFFGILISGYIQTFDISFQILTNTFYIMCTFAIIIRLLVYISLVKKISDVRETAPLPNDQLVIGVLTFEPVRETVQASATLLLATTEKELTTTFTTMKKIKTQGEADIKEGVMLFGRIGATGTKKIVKTARQAEELAVEGIEKVEDITLTGIEKVEDITLTGIEKAEEITVKGLKKAKNRIILEKEKRRAKGFI